MRRNPDTDLWTLAGLVLGGVAAWLIFSPAQAGPQPPAPPPTDSGDIPPPPADAGKSGLEWRFVKLWMWTGTSWQRDTAHESPPALMPADWPTPQQQANMVQSVPRPPVYVSQVFRWTGTAWQYVARGSNWGL